MARAMPPSKSSLQFAVWTTGASGAGTEYNTGTNYRLFNKTTTLYAQYVGNVDYFLTYNTGNDLIAQSNWMQSHITGISSKTKADVKNINVETAADFVSAWNNLAAKDDVDNVHIFVHSGVYPGYPIVYMKDSTVVLDAKNSSANKSFSDLNKLRLKGKVYYNGCQGGTVSSKTSIARELAKRTNDKRVKAMVGAGVSFGFPPRFLFGRRPRSELNSNGTSKGYWADIDKDGAMTNTESVWYYNATDKQCEDAKTDYPAGAFP